MECSVCGAYIAELHHIVHRSAAPYMANVKLNHMYLCYGHHRYKNGPHMSREIDIKYKKELQEKLVKLFNTKKYYSVVEIADKLEIKEKEAQQIVKTLTWYPAGGYKVLDVVKRCMGDMLYDD